METGFRVRAIAPDILTRLRHYDDAGNRGEPLIGESEPLRCCLRHARPGEPILLVSYAPLRHWAASTGADPGPYVELGPVYIHAEDCGGPQANSFEEMRGALRVCRGYDRRGRIRDGKLVDPTAPHAADTIEEAVHDLFAHTDIEFIHVRAVEHGCFFFEVHRR
jgi:hypothetical protein